MDKRIGAQLFTVRDYMQTIEDFDKTCKKIADIGYKIVQVSGSPLEADKMREVLDRYDLKTVVTHRGYDDFKNRLEWVMDYNKTLGSEVCGLGMMPVECFADGDKFEEFLKYSRKICDELKKNGLKFGYHNHSWEFAKYKGKTILDILAEETDPDIFTFILDTYWIQYGGANPTDIIEKLGKRVVNIHFKDYTVKHGTGDAQMCEIGEGNLNWDSIINTCEKSGAKWVLVEQDVCERDPFESLKMSYDYLTDKGFC